MEKQNFIKYATDIKLPENIDIHITNHGLKYSVLENNSDFLVYKSFEAPVFYASDTPEEVLELRRKLNSYLDDDGIIETDLIIHCSQKHFMYLMKI
ncbi:MAG: hypothetical protein PUE12_08385 [Oscillospiraceae bacterium]|nr:hypothetical protein [Oscillospiraceae bacterium]